MWGLWPDFYYYQTIAGLLIWGALSDERTGLSFTMYNIQYILLSQIWDQVPVFISSRNRVARLYPQTLGITRPTDSPLESWLLSKLSADGRENTSKGPAISVSNFSYRLPAKPFTVASGAVHYLAVTAETPYSLRHVQFWPAVVQQPTRSLQRKRV
jgi:hypothetical protein